MATRNDIILGALKLTGEYSPGETPSSADMEDAGEFLNDLVLEYAADGLHLWQRELIAVTPVSGTTSYTIGSSGAADVTADRPLTVHQAYIRSADGSDTTLVKLSRQEYQELATKTSTGRTNQFYYQPTIPDGTVYFYPTPNSTEVIYLDCHVAMDTFDSASDTQDFPPEWTRFLKYALALDLAIMFTIPDNQYQKIQMGYNISYQRVLDHDSEDSSIKLQPENARRY